MNLNQDSGKWRERHTLEKQLEEELTVWRCDCMRRVKYGIIIMSPGFLDWVARLNSSTPTKIGKTGELAGMEEINLFLASLS